jgi:hypothetical protein
VWHLCGVDLSSSSACLNTCCIHVKQLVGLFRALLWLPHTAFTLIKSRSQLGLPGPFVRWGMCDLCQSCAVSVVHGVALYP